MNWQYSEIKFTGVLSNYIDCVWVENFITLQGNKGHTQYILPDNSIELIFTDSNITRHLPHSQRGQEMQSHLCGLKTTFQKVKVERSPLIGVRFKIGGFYRLTQVEKKTIINAHLSPEECFGKEISNLQEQLFLAKTFEERFDLITIFFINLFLQKKIKEDLLFERAIALIDCSKGVISISCLAERLGVSVKTIERKFIFNLGITPKRYCNLLRVYSSLKQATQFDTLTSISYAYGFYDQAHFIKEVKSHMGLTPKKFRQLDKGVQTPTFS